MANIRSVPDVPPGKKPWVRRDAVPYKPGNMEAVKHGVFSDDMVSTRALRVHAEFMEACPWLVDIDVMLVDIFCKAKARHEMMNEHVMRVSEESGIDSVKPYLWGEVSRAEANVMKAIENLGLDPTGRARLLKDMGFARQLANENVGKLTAKGAEMRRGAQ